MTVRVAFFVPSLGVGGAERHVARVASGARGAGLEVRVYVARGGGSYEATFDGPIVALQRGWTTRSSTLSLAGSSVPLMRELARFRPDVLMSALDPANVLTAAVTLGLGRQRPRLVHSVQNALSVKYGPTASPARRSLLPFIRWSHGVADRVVALSHGVADDLERMSPRARGKVTTIFNAGFDDGVHALASAPPPPGFSDGGPLVVACGRLTHQKGFDVLLDAWARVRRQVDARLCIVGAGPDAGSLRAQAERLGVEGSVRWAGFQANPFPFFAAADLFVLSSRFEGFGLVLTEAMALGLPVVSTDCRHGPREILGEDAGLLVPVEDVDALATALVRVLRDGDLRSQLSARGHERSRRFHASESTAAHVALFERLAAGAAA